MCILWTSKPMWKANYFKIWSVNFMVHFAFDLVVPLLPLYLSETFGATRQMIGVCLAGYAVMAILIRPMSGFIVDSFPRKAVLMACALVFAAVFGGYIFAGSLVVFAIFRTLHGLPFGALTVSASTVMIDVLPSDRRAAGIGYYGLSNNLAKAIGPAVAVWLLHAVGGRYQVLFWLSLLFALGGFALCCSMKMPRRDFVPPSRVLSTDRFFLMKGWREALSMVPLAFAYGIISTYVAIYGKEELGITRGTGLFFTLFAVGLIISRLTGTPALRRNLVARNAALGIIVSAFGYLLFALLHNPVGYYGAAFIIGLGNGHMFPAYQTMFINLAEHNQRGTANSSVLTAWDLGIGLGMLFGGLLSGHFGYATAFWTAFFLYVAGALYFILGVRPHFERCKLR